MKSSIENKVLIDFYKGAYGPTIRIDVQSEKHLLYFIDLFISLSKNEKLEDNIGGLDFIHLNNIKGFVLKVDIKNTFNKKALIINGNLGDYVCQWNNPSHGWGICAELISHIEATNWHQYLTEEGIDDALVEFAYMEPRNWF